MKNQSIKNTTRGGQVILHNLRIISQVVQKVALWTLPLAALFMFGWFFLTTEADQRWIGHQWLSAEFHLFFNGSHFPQRFIFPSGQQIRVTSGQIVRASFVMETIQNLQESLYRSFCGD